MERNIRCRKEAYWRKISEVDKFEKRYATRTKTHEVLLNASISRAPVTNVVVDSLDYASTSFDLVNRHIHPVADPAIHDCKWRTSCTVNVRLRDIDEDNLKDALELGNHGKLNQVTSLKMDPYNPSFHRIRRTII